MAIPVAVLVMGVAITAALCAAFAHFNAVHLTHELQRQGQAAIAAITARVQGFERGIRGTRGAVLVGGQEHMSVEMYRIYAASRDPLVEFPGARGFGFIERVDQHYRVKFVSPEDENRNLIGMDLAAQAAPKLAADAAMRSGSATMTPPLVEPGAASGRQLFLVVLPIYRPALPLDTPRQRDVATLGWAFAILDLGTVLRGIDLAEGLELRIEDGANASSPAALFDLQPLRAHHAVAAATPVTVDLFGRWWTFTGYAGGAFAANLNHTPIRWVFGIGLTVTLLATALAAGAAARMRGAVALRLQQELLAQVVADASDAIVLQSAQGHLLGWNAGAQSLFGYGADEALGRRLSELIVPPSQLHEEYDLIRRCLGGEQVASLDTVRRRRDGSEVEVSITASPMRDDMGVVHSIASTIRDITLRKAHERQLQSEKTVLEHTLVSITDAMPSMIGYWDRELVNRFANRAYQTWFGIDADAIKGMRMQDLLGEPLFARNREAIESALSGSKVSFERELPDRQSGRPTTQLVHYLPDVIGGEVKGFFVLVHDITPLKESQRRLGAISERLALATQGAEIGVWEWDVAAQKIWWDPQMHALYEHPISQTDGLYDIWLTSLHPEDRERVSSQLQQALEGKTRFDLEFRMQLPTGTQRHIKASGQVQWDARGNAIRMVGVNHDITKRKAAEQSLMESEAKFRSLFELSPVGIALNDLATGQFLETNESLAEPTGYTPSELMKLTYWDITPPRYRDAEDVQLQDLRELSRYGPYEKEYQRKDGSTYPVLLSGIRLRDTAGRAVIWSIVQDISERKAMESRLAQAARTDKLTGLANRALFMERLELAVARVQSGEQGSFAVLFLDFDRFKMINDTLGHQSGDSLLRQIATRLRAELRSTDTLSSDERGNFVSRFGGDEFLVLINELLSTEDAPLIAERLLNALAPAYLIDGSEVHSSASIGIVTSDQCHSSAEDVVRNADVAMYEAKRAGRACSVVFNEAMHKRLTRHVAIENSLRRAIGTEEMYLVYQPIVDIESGRVVSVEALVRWNHPLLGVVAPSEFIPIAEESNLIVALGQWVQREACNTMAMWRKQDGELSPNTVSVNISRAELELGGRLIEQVSHILSESGLPAKCLQLEVTEREVMRHPETAHASLHALQRLGVRLAMDDFGTGTSSLGFLRNYPFDTIKIDRSFIQDVISSTDVLAVIHATINLVENLGMVSLAEGVEDGAQLALLQSLGCRYAQGYFLSQPVLGAELLDGIRALASRRESESLVGRC